MLSIIASLLQDIQSCGSIDTDCLEAWWNPTEQSPAFLSPSLPQQIDLVTIVFLCLQNATYIVFYNLIIIVSVKMPLLPSL